MTNEGRRRAGAGVRDTAVVLRPAEVRQMARSLEECAAAALGDMVVASVFQTAADRLFAVARLRAAQSRGKQSR